LIPPFFNDLSTSNCRNNVSAVKSSLIEFFDGITLVCAVFWSFILPLMAYQLVYLIIQTKKKISGEIPKSKLKFRWKLIAVITVVLYFATYARAFGYLAVHGF